MRSKNARGICFLLSKEERILEIFSELLVCNAIALIASDLLLDMKELIDKSREEINVDKFSVSYTHLTLPTSDLV